SVTCRSLLRHSHTPPNMRNPCSDERSTRTPWHICCLDSTMRTSGLTKPVSRVLAVKGAIVFSLVLSALPMIAGELPSLRSPMARYETGSQHYAPVTQPSSVGSAADFAFAALPHATFNLTSADELPVSNPPATFAAQISASEFTKARTPVHHWLDVNGPGSVGMGRFGFGYGSVYYDSFYGKPLVFFEGKGTRVEEPGCGYLKMSFTF